MKILLEKRDEYWWLNVDGKPVIRTPYVVKASREEVVGYAQRIYPDATIYVK
jgi:hypothetical protein